MIAKIYYLARSYAPYQKGGGPLMRAGAVNNLMKLGWEIVVIVPNYTSSEIIQEDNIIQIPFGRKYHQKLTSLLERVGFYEDYLDKWIEAAFAFLENRIKKEDIVFATSGGELGMIKLGSLLKNQTGCKFVINFRDPLNYGYMNGLRRDKKFHVGREKEHEKYMANADLILTSSQHYADVLTKRFGHLSDRIVNNYFGYIKKLDLNKYQKQNSGKIKIAYAGTMGKTQSPELLYQSWKEVGDDHIEIYFIGDISRHKPLQNIRDKGVYFIETMPHDKFMAFMCETVDVGFVSLASDYFGACFPSKIYEYINLGLPILGALPKGDSLNIINKHGYGAACIYNDKECLSKAMKKMKDREYLTNIQEKILKDRDNWSMENTILEVNHLLREIIK